MTASAAEVAAPSRVYNRERRPAKTGEIIMEANLTNSGGDGRQMLRHTLATLAYRASRALGGAPETFAGFSIADHPKTPALILAHMGDLADWGLSAAKGKQVWRDSVPLPWAEEVRR